MGCACSAPHSTPAPVEAPGKPVLSEQVGDSGCLCSSCSERRWLRSPLFQEGKCYSPYASYKLYPSRSIAGVPAGDAVLQGASSRLSLADRRWLKDQRASRRRARQSELDCPKSPDGEGARVRLAEGWPCHTSVAQTLGDPQFVGSSDDALVGAPATAPAAQAPWDVEVLNSARLQVPGDSDQGRGKPGEPPPTDSVVCVDCLCCECFCRGEPRREPQDPLIPDGDPTLLGQPEAGAVVEGVLEESGLDGAGLDAAQGAVEQASVAIDNGGLETDQGATGALGADEPEQPERTQGDEARPLELDIMGARRARDRLGRR